MARKDGYENTDLNKGWKGAGQANVKESRINGKNGKGPHKGKKSK